MVNKSKNHANISINKGNDSTTTGRLSTAKEFQYLIVLQGKTMSATITWIIEWMPCQAIENVINCLRVWCDSENPQIFHNSLDQILA